jgi:SAM-dependent methyltransferase
MEGYRAATYGEQIADVYDSWYEAKDASDDCVFLRALAGDGPALELGIGTGRVALPLRTSGVEVHGIDASPAMVEQLRAKPGGADIPITIGDFADVDAPGGPYSLVYIVFNTFFALLTQDDQVRCFANVARNLRPGGHFVVEAFLPDTSRFDRNQRLSAVRVVIDEVRLDVGIHDPVAQTVINQHLLFRDGEPVRLLPISLRYAYPPELDLMARLAGLELESRGDGWHGAPVTGSSAAVVSVWRKPA